MAEPLVHRCTDGAPCRTLTLYLTEAPPFTYEALRPEHP